MICSCCSGVSLENNSAAKMVFNTEVFVSCIWSTSPQLLSSKVAAGSIAIVAKDKGVV